MTALRESAKSATPTNATSRRVFSPAALLPWLIPAVALVAGLLRTHTPPGDIALYAAYFAAAIVAPGTLVHRALRGSRGNLPEDLGLGAATGLVVLLIGWAFCAATRLQVLLPFWPLLILVLFVAVPALRRHWRIPAGEREPLPLLWSWVIAGALVTMVALAYPSWVSLPLPPATADYYQDMLYHLALVHEMTRSIPFQVPQVAGDTLRYHYLSDADIAAASMITKIPPAVVLFRLWIVPICGVTVFVTAALARTVARTWWAGALAGAAAVVAIPLYIGEPTRAFGSAAISMVSPSQTYVLPLLGLLVLLAVDAISGRPLGRAWVMVFPVALACAGGKSSALPPFVAGLVLAAVVVLVRYRDRLRATLTFLGLTLAAMLIGVKIFAGGGAGTLALQPFAILYWVVPYKRTIGGADTIDGSRFLPLGVEQAGAGGAVFIAGLIVWWIALQTPRLLGLLTLVRERTRTEPAAWLLAGMTVAGTGAVWALWHPSASQVYFFTCVIPFATVLTAWLLADHARSLRPVVAGLIAGVVWAELAPHVAAPNPSTVVSWSWRLLLPLLISFAAAVVVGAAGVLVWRLITGRLAYRALPVALIAAVLGAGMAAGLDGDLRGAYSALVRPVHKSSHPTWEITADEQRAALWLGDHAGNDDVIATNVHCHPMDGAGRCDARAFWVAGLAGRRTLIESWAYADQTVAADGVNGLRYVYQPAPYPDRFALNQRAFAQGDPADVAALRDQYHVRWLLADTRAPGGVSPELARSARLVYSSGTAAVYRL